MSKLLRLLFPIAPHITQYISEDLGLYDDLSKAPWPKVAMDALNQSHIQWVIQVNGKLRDHMSLPADYGREAIVEAALKQDNIQRHLNGGIPKKLIVVPGKLVNIVI